MGTLTTNDGIELGYRDSGGDGLRLIRFITRNIPDARLHVFPTDVAT